MDPIDRGMAQLGRMGAAAELDEIPATAAAVLHVRPGSELAQRLEDEIAMRERVIEIVYAHLTDARARIARAREIAYDALDYDTPTLHRIVHALDGTLR